MEDNVLLVEKRDSVCTVIFNRPDKRNALTPDLLSHLIEVLRETNADTSVRVVVIRGAGEEAFSSGFDLGGVRGPQPQQTQRTAAGSLSPNPLQSAIDNIMNHRCPVIAMINGAAIGGALDLASSCDIRLASDKARFALPPAKLGIMYYADGIRRMVDLVGTAAAKQLLFTADYIDARRAREIGLVNEVFPSGELEKQTYDMAGRIAKNAPLSVAGLKAIISKVTRRLPLSEQDEAECRAIMERCIGSNDRLEGIRAFKEKRLPRFEGR